MHKDNPHNRGYDFKRLVASHPSLSTFIKLNPGGNKTIDFRNFNAIKALNNALLKSHYNVTTAPISDKFLVPPIPGRVDYLYHLKDLATSDKINILDIGTGASLIYPLLGAALFNWHFKAVDVNSIAIEMAQEQLTANSHLRENIIIQHQSDKGSIFKNIIQPEDVFTFTMCNPPFFMSQEDALKANLQKNKNLGHYMNERNFKGISDELWCNGGESLFIKRMIKESVLFKSQVQWFTTLVSKKDHLPKLLKQLNKMQAMYKVIPMAQGQKKSRILVWRFDS